MNNQTSHSTNPKSRIYPRLSPSRPQLIIFIAIFSLVGGFIIYNSFASQALPSDINNDGQVDITDLSILLSNYGTNNTSADINNDGQVDITDLSILLSNYGAIAPPSNPQTAALPSAPATYTVPSGAQLVNSSASLQAALNQLTAKDIVLANGTYDNATYFQNSYGHRIYAQNLGGATLTAGLVFGNNVGQGNGLVQGVRFNVNNQGKTLQNSIIHIWGTGSGTRVYDVTIHGNDIISSGLVARQVEGLKISRVVAQHFLEFGILVDTNDANTVVTNKPIIEDIDASYVSLPNPVSSNGRSEACVWVGNTANVRRVKATHCAWEGLWLGTAAHNSLIEDITVNNTYAGVGIYIEHFSRNSTLRRLNIGPNIDRGIMCEWADPTWGSLPACVDNIIEDSIFDTYCIGVVLDEGTTRTTIRRSTFKNQWLGAINNYRNTNTGNLADTGGNNYNLIKPGASQITYDHASRCFERFTPAWQGP